MKTNLLNLFAALCFLGVIIPTTGKSQTVNCETSLLNDLQTSLQSYGIDASINIMMGGAYLNANLTASQMDDLGNCVQHYRDLAVSCPTAYEILVSCTIINGTDGNTSYLPAGSTVRSLKGPKKR
jgi:hypothetical protein